MGYIYISYSRKDLEAAKNIQAALQARGYTLWNEAQDFIPGRAWKDQIDQAIADAEIFVVLLSQDSIASRTTTSEIALAESLQKPIIPVLLEPVPIPSSLLNRQFVDAAGKPEQSIERLAQAIDASLGLSKTRRSQMPAPQAAAPVSAAQRKSRRSFPLMRLVLILLLIVVIGFVASLLFSKPGVPAGNATQTSVAIGPTVTPIALARVVIARQKLPRGIKIPSEAVGFAFWPVASIPEFALSDVEDVVGKVALTDIVVEEPILSSMVSSEVASPTITGLPTDTAEPTETLEITADTQSAPTLSPLTDTAIAQTALVEMSQTPQLAAPSPNPTIPLVGNSASLGCGTVESPCIMLLVTPTPAASSTKVQGQGNNSTVIAVKPTEGNVSPSSETAQLVSIATNNNNILLLLTGILGLISGVVITLLAVVRSSSNRRVAQHAITPAAHGSHAEANETSTEPEPLLEEYQVFVSSSDKDKEWVKLLVDDLMALGYLTWWYVKDAPGLPFGHEIRSAIYHTKVFVIIVTPNSMSSKHTEEELRWAEVYNRPIIPVLYRFVPVEERLYGLAKGAVVDFTNEREYKGAIELLTQAIDHYLKKRVQELQTGKSADKNSESENQS